jgi:hypothetical protein
MKKGIIGVVGLFVVLTLVAAPAVFADHGGYKKACPVCDKGPYQCPVTGKFMQKAVFFLSNKEGIGLSDEQEAKIKSLKMGVKKLHIRQTADMEVFMLEIIDKMSQPAVDVEGLNAMVDEGSAKMAASTKEVIAAYAELKGVLSEEQAAKAKAIWRSQK